MDKFDDTQLSRKDIDSAVASKLGDNLNPHCRCGWPQNMMLPRGYGLCSVWHVDYTGQLDPVSCTDSTGALMPLFKLSLVYRVEKYSQFLSVVPRTRGITWNGVTPLINKTWDSRVHSTASVRDIIKNMPHIKNKALYKTVQWYS